MGFGKEANDGGGGRCIGLTSEQRAAPARGPCGRSHSSSTIGLLLPLFQDSACILPLVGQAPLTPGVTLALRCSAEFAAEDVNVMGMAGALGVPQGTFGHLFHGLRCNLCLLCFEKCGQRL